MVTTVKGVRIMMGVGQGRTGRHRTAQDRQGYRKLGQGKTISRNRTAGISVDVCVSSNERKKNAVCQLQGLQSYARR